MIGEDRGEVSEKNSPFFCDDERRGGKKGGNFYCNYT